jgi:NADH-quinone oxidoreductase subunit H
MVDTSALSTLFGLYILNDPGIDALIRLVIIVGVMTVVVMGLIWYERKLLGRIQMRLGPMRTGPFGILQSLADAIKLIGKEDLRPRSADSWLFELAPYAVFVPIFLAFVTLPFASVLAVRNLDLGLFFVVAVTGLSTIGLLMAAWGSDNKYALIGGLRAAAMLISYEIPLVLTVVAVAMLPGTLNLAQIVEYQGKVPLIVWQPLAFVIFFTATFAELNRQPFDIAIGESEVVGGPFIEYSGIRWSMFFLAEYAALFVLGTLGALVFLGGYTWPFAPDFWLWQVLLVAVKSFFLISVNMWVRGSMPRLRIDQLMGLCWKLLLPFTLLQILLNGFILMYGLPQITFLITSGASLVAFAWVIRWIVSRAPKAPDYVRRYAYAGHS